MHVFICRTRLLLESLLECNHLWIVDHQHSNCHWTDLCQRLELGAVPYEVFRPLISSRMEEAKDLAGVWIEPRNVGPFGPICCGCKTGQDSRIRFVCASMLPSDDVIDLESSRVECTTRDRYGRRNAAEYAGSSCHR